MAKFFNNIRKTLINQGPPAGRAGKTANYLKYAIGEIVLVVIGILIALQINNWNEDRKFKQLKSVYIERLMDDLKQDTLQVRLLLEKVNYRQQCIEHAIKDIDTDLKSESELASIEKYFEQGWNMADFTPSDNTYSDLSQTGNMNVFGNTELITLIKNYYVAIEDGIKGQNINKDWIIPLDVALSKETTAFNFDPVTRNLFKKEGQQQAIQNLIEHKELFKRNAAGHYWFNHSLIGDSKNYRALAIELLNRLKTELNKN